MRLLYTTGCGLHKSTLVTLLVRIDDLQLFCGLAILQRVAYAVPYLESGDKKTEDCRRELKTYHRWTCERFVLCEPLVVLVDDGKDV
jgi:hypothetical protein